MVYNLTKAASEMGNEHGDPSVKCPLRASLSPPSEWGAQLDT